MWARVNAQSVSQENAVNLMQIDMLQLNVLQTQLDNVSMQATLIIGFALGMWAGETLDPLLDDVGPHCIYKSSAHMIISFIFFSAVALCITNCFVAVMLASYIKQAAQGAALLVCTGAAVANTQRHMQYIYNCFTWSVFFFIASAGLLIWLFVGLPSRIPYAPEAEVEEDESIIRLTDGAYLITCLDRLSPVANHARDAHGFLIATANTAILVGMGLRGAMRFRAVRASYEPQALLEWWSTHKAQQAGLHDAIRQKARMQAGGGVAADTYFMHDSDADSTEAAD